MEKNTFYQRMIRAIRWQNMSHTWPGKSLDAPAVSRYPNVAAEIEAASGWLWCPAQHANVSQEVLAAVLEDGEELSFREMRGLARLYECNEQYLSAHTLQMIDPSTNKGKRRLLELRSLIEQSEGLEVISSWNVERTQEQMERGEPVTYAAWRQACQNLNYALWRSSCMSRPARTARIVAM